MTLERSDEVVVAGKRVPVYYENESGQMIIPSNIERELVLDFVGRALATPVTALTIIVGGAMRDIIICYGSVLEDIKTVSYEIKVKGEVDRMNSVLKQFGSAIKRLDHEDYPNEVIQIHKEQLMARMYQRYEQIKKM